MQMPLLAAPGHRTGVILLLLEVVLPLCRQFGP